MQFLSDAFGVSTLFSILFICIPIAIIIIIIEIQNECEWKIFKWKQLLNIPLIIIIHILNT